MREDLIAELRELCAIEGRPLTVGERARTKIAMSEAAAALEAAREDGDDAARWRYLRDSKACSLSISHNDHHNMYMSVADALDEPQGYYSDISDNERAAMIETDTIWTLHVYPNSPVGFNVYHAATLDAAIDQARGKGVADEA